MEVISASYRVSSWNSVDELQKVFQLIFGEDSSLDDKHKAYLILQSWKVRRSYETLTGVLCTLSLLDVHLKDEMKKITDPFTLSTLYASSLTKFINFATSFQIHNTSMYRSAHQLGIESFLVDIRHMCAHGKQLPSLEVFRRTHRYCLNWIKKFFWESELKNVADVTSKDIRYDVELAEKLKGILPFYDTMAEMLHKGVDNFQDLAADDTAKLRWPTLDKFMKEKHLKNFRQAFNLLTMALTRVIESKTMSMNPRTFFHEMFERCDFFMSASEDIGEVTGDSSDESVDDDSDTEATPAKRMKRQPKSVVNLYQNFIWQIARHDYLKLFVDMLYQLSLNENESASRRSAARFWITIILGSFSYYQRYCQFSNDNALMQKKINGEVRKIYSYQLDADLTKVFIFVGTQLLPSSLKYSREFFMQLMNSADADNEGICMALLPFVYPPLTPDQLNNIGDLVKIGSDSTRKGQKSEDEVFTVDDLLQSQQNNFVGERANLIWQKSLDNVDWSAQPIGKDFSIES